MKRIFKLLIACFVSMPLSLSAQQTVEQGINFDKSMSWKEVVEKATAENKYIYIDVMATWCGPCQAMVKNVFSRKDVGDFYNKNFINIKLQTDKTADDSEYVKAWHKEAEWIRKECRVQAFPTSLYFNPKGEFVHVVRGAVLRPEEFIRVGQIALDENRQIITSMRRFEAGEKDVEFLYNLSMDFLELGDMEQARKVANVFWQTITPEERLEKRGIQYAGDFFQSVDDAMLSLFMEHPDKVDAVLGKGMARSKVVRAMDKKYLIPLMKDSVNMPQWSKIQSELTERYPKMKDAIRDMVAGRKLWYAHHYHNDTLCVSALKEILVLCDPEKDKMLAHGYAYELGLLAQKKEDSKIAIEWLEKTLDTTSPYQLIDYAQVLFKCNQKGKGLKQVNAALDLIPDKESSLYKKAMNLKKDNAREMKILKEVVNGVAQ